jgi:flagellin
MPATGDLTRIRTNLQALNALEALRGINNALNVANLRLSTGKRLNSAADDPSGMTLGNKLEVQGRRIGQAINNIGDSENVLNIAEGGLGNLRALLNDMNEKVLQAANDTQGPNERSAIFTQLQQLGEEIDSVARQTQFNSVVLLTVNTMTFQSGPDGADITVWRITQSFTSSALGVNNLTVASQTLASTSLGSVTTAINNVSNVLQQVGAALQRLRVKSDNLSIAKLNVTAAQSRIMDADLAAEQLESSKLQILQQTATAMLAAANASPASILTLFQ